jgi:DNA-directed RNA polymerase subunit alpha
VLKREGVATADELILIRESDLLDMRNMGQKGVDEIKGRLAALGLSLRAEQQP